MLRAKRYQEALAEQWDAFVAGSKNGTFLHLRAFMSYHESPLVDHSFVVSDLKGKIVALLPANLVADGTLMSHGGLTYGGFITGVGMTQPLMLDVFETTLIALQSAGHRRLVYKTIPGIHHRIPAEEDRYALFLCGAELVARDVWPVIPRADRAAFQERRRRGCRKALAAGLRVEECRDLAAYWAIVEELLAGRGSKPVHSRTEIEKLKRCFPERIRLFAAFRDGDMVAGVLIFESERVARAQYIASTAAGKESYALDLVFSVLLNEYYVDKPFFDFGTTTLDGGRSINIGLSDQKEGFGARTVVHDRYEIDLRAWNAKRLRDARS